MTHGMTVTKRTSPRNWTSPTEPKTSNQSDTETAPMISTNHSTMPLDRTVRRFVPLHTLPESCAKTLRLANAMPPKLTPEQYREKAISDINTMLREYHAAEALDIDPASFRRVSRTSIATCDADVVTERSNERIDEIRAA